LKISLNNGIKCNWDYSQFIEVLCSPYETNLSSGINKTTITLAFNRLKEDNKVLQPVDLIIGESTFIEYEVGRYLYYVVTNSSKEPIFFAKLFNYGTYLESSYAWRDKNYVETKNLLLILYTYLLKRDKKLKTSFTVSEDGKKFWIRFSNYANAEMFLSRKGVNTPLKNIEEAFSKDESKSNTQILFTL
jgi:subtilase family serine protease